MVPALRGVHLSGRRERRSYLAQRFELPAARAEALARLAALIGRERWALAAPSAAQVRAASPAVGVAWDWIASAGEAGGDLSIAALIEAHARAERLGLDWRDPVARAVAERASDEARVRDLLAPRRELCDSAQ